MAKLGKFEGRVLGRYHLTRMIAKGGTGNVYLARVEGAFGFEKVVAVKVIHPDFAKDPHVLSLIREEALITSRIHHSNVCSILDFDVADGVPYLVMEFLRGLPFSKVWLAGKESGKLAPPLVARIVADAARGLHAAHELRGKDGKSLGVIHRDISPQNLFILYEGRVKVLDFGVAYAQKEAPSTHPKEIKGKVTYMAPELLRQDPVDRRADVWSLAVVLWETTVGRPLYSGSDVAQIIYEILEAPILPPREIDRTYPAQLEGILLRALAHDQHYRTESAAAFAKELEAYLYGTGKPWGAAQIASFMEEHFPDQIRRQKEMETTILKPYIIPAYETGKTKPISLESAAEQDQSQTNSKKETQLEKEKQDIKSPLKSSHPADEDEESSRTQVIAKGNFQTASEETPTEKSAFPEQLNKTDTSTKETAKSARTTPPTPRSSTPRPEQRTLRNIVRIALLSVLILLLTTAYFVTTRIQGRMIATENSAMDQPSNRPMRSLAFFLSLLDAKSPSSSLRDGSPSSVGNDSAPESDENDGSPNTTSLTKSRDKTNVSKSNDERQSQKSKQRKGILTLYSSPSASVHWKGISLGRTPIVQMPMIAGRHRLNLRPQNGGKAKTITVRILPGKTTSRRIRFE